MTQQVASLSQLDRRRRMVVVLGTMLALFTVGMDQTLVGTALPRVVASLGGLGLFPWVFTAFMVTSTTFVPLVGKLTDLYGRKPFYMAGVAILVVGSALCGASRNMEELIAFRAIQGLGAGAVMSIAFTVIGDLFAPAERSKYVGLFTGTFATASILGPLIGGALTDYVHWRWVFYVNLPIGLVVLAVLALGMPALRPIGQRRPLDWRGFLLMPAVIVPLLLAFSWGGDKFGWSSGPVLGLFAGAALALVAFTWAELRAEEPALPLHLFRNPVFLVASLVTVIIGVAMFGAISFIPLFVQGVKGATATNSGLVTMPLTLAMASASTIGGQVIARMGRYRWVTVLGLAVVPLAMFMFSRLDQGSPRLQVTLDMVMLGIGLGLAMPPLTLAVQNALPHRFLGISTSAIQFLRQIGAVMGVAIVGSQINAAFARELPARLPAEAQSLPPSVLAVVQQRDFLLSREALAGLQQQFQALGPGGESLFQQVVEAARGALATAIGEGFFVAFAICISAFVVGLFLKEVPLRRSLLTSLGDVEGAVPLASDGPVPSDLADAPRDEGRQRGGTGPRVAEGTGPGGPAPAP